MAAATYCFPTAATIAFVGSAPRESLPPLWAPGAQGTRAMADPQRRRGLIKPSAWRWGGACARGAAQPRPYSKLDSSLGLSWSRRVLRALFQDYGHFKQSSIGIVAGLPAELIESRALE